MDLDLKGKLAIVTGSGRGIGRTIALTLAEEGANVVVNDIVNDWAEKVAEECRDKGVKALAIAANVGNGEEVNQMMKKAVDEFGKVDIMVNNAGSSGNWAAGYRPAPFTELDKELCWDFTINLCLYGVLNCTKAVLPGMIDRKYGKIINTVSDAGRIGEPLYTIYSAAKGGIIAFAKALSKEVGRHNINVNCVSPGMTVDEKTIQMWEEEKGIDKEAFAKSQQALLREYPMRRLGEPVDVARACVFLASDVSRHITGQTLSVSGGYTTIS